STLPVIECAVRHFEAGGGIILTASHNPIEWNGIKFISSFEEDATLLSARFMFRIRKNWDKVRLEEKKEEEIPETVDYLPEYNHEVKEKIKEMIERLSGEKGLGERLEEKIRRKNFRIGLDATSLEGARIPLSFLSELGIKEVKVINTGPIESCLRRLEPAPEFLDDLRKTIQKDSLDIGFATDPDQDRIVALPLLTEEHTPLLTGKFLMELQSNNLRKPLKKIVVNLSTTSAWEEIAGKHGVEIVRVPVGEINIVEGMKKTKTFLGIEGNGGVIVSSINYGRNSTVAMALLLFYLAWRNKNLTELEKELPRYCMVKDKIELPGREIHSFLEERIKRIWKDKREQVKYMDTRDGYKILFKDFSWVHLRPSNTEPIVRIFAEKREASREEVKELVVNIKNFFIEK
ncbi:hypothetical protein J7K43_00195, partial [Candidatus Calescamantes bacterium]|nr:hypothetical protein [Candidatus Calescamantes bacterium]